MRRSNTSFKAVEWQPRLAIVLSLLAIAGFPLLLPGTTGKSFAAPNYSLYLSPSSGSYAIGSEVTVNIREDSGSLPVIAAQVNVSYDTYDLSYVSSNFSNSAFEINAASYGGNGLVEFSRGTTNQNLTGDQEVGQVTFIATAPGLAFVNIGSGSVVLQTTNDQDEVTSLINASFTIHAAVSMSSLSAPYTPTYSPPSIVSSLGSATSTSPVTEPTPAPTGASSPANFSSSTSSQGVSNQSVLTQTDGASQLQPETGPADSITPSGSTTPVILPNNSEVKVAVPAMLRPETSPTSTSKVYKVEYFLNSILLATVTTAPYSYSLNTKNILNGTYNLTTKTFYSDGKILTSTQVVVVNNPESVSQLKLAGQKYMLPWVVDGLIVIGILYVFVLRRNPLTKNLKSFVPVPAPVTDTPPAPSYGDQNDRPKNNPNALDDSIVIQPVVPRSQMELDQESKDLQSVIPLSRTHETVLTPTSQIKPSSGTNGSHKLMK